MLWAAGLAVAALAAFVAFQVADNNSTSVAPAQTEVGSVANVIRQSDLAAQAPSISDLIRQAETFQAPAVADVGPLVPFQPAPLANPAAASVANPAAASAIGQSAAAAVAVNPAQAGAISGPAVSATPPIVANDLGELAHPALAPVAAPSFFEELNRCVPSCGAARAEAEPIADDLGELAHPKAAVNPNLGGATPF